MMALKRIVEPCGGRILIDGVDTGCVTLFDLRSRLALVPQVSCPTAVDVLQFNAPSAWAVRGLATQTTCRRCRA
jgi:hypothetical protein